MKSTLTKVRVIPVWFSGTTNDLLAEAGFIPETCSWFKTDNEFDGVALTLVVHGKLACNMHVVTYMVCAIKASLSHEETAADVASTLPKRVEVDIGDFAEFARKEDRKLARKNTKKPHHNRSIKESALDSLSKDMEISRNEMVSRLHKKLPQDAGYLAQYRQTWKDFDGGLSPI